VRRSGLIGGVLAALLVSTLAAGCNSGGSDNASVRPRHLPPVVVIVFDEFAADTLNGPDGKIDAERFPNFAALARISTWFPNGHTAYDSTFKAVPAILDSRLPRRGTAPDVRSHQPSIFNLLAKLGYGVVKVESASAVCPPRICPGARTRRPGVLKRLAGGRRPGRLDRWIGAIRRRSRPMFYFHHTLLPHEPWIYLPSGHRSRPVGNDPVEGINRPAGFGDPRLTDHNHLRHLLQVGFVDHELGLVLRRLRRTHQLRQSLLVVVADHGYSFRVGVKSRRLVSDANIEEIGPVPFFVKAPGQMHGAVNESLVRNMEVLPTVADLLGVRIPWRIDGHSAFSDVVRDRDAVQIPTRDFSRVIRIGRAELERRRNELRLRQAALFGTGAESDLLFGDPWAMAYRIGPDPELLDRRVADLHVVRAGGLRARVANADLVRHVAPSAEILPTRVTGVLSDGGRAPRRLAAAVNGRIRAGGWSFHLGRRRREFFSFVVPEDAMHPGRNRVEVFEIKPGPVLVPLADL